jgi:hypothetical protein
MLRCIKNVAYSLLLILSAEEIPVCCQLLERIMSLRAQKRTRGSFQ